MKVRNEYTEDFRQQALKKVYKRGNRSVKSIAEELNMSHKTLANWMRASKTTRRQGGHGKTASERFHLLMESHGLVGEALNGYCREKGIFSHQLAQWQKEFEQTGSLATDRSSVVH